MLMLISNLLIIVSFVLYFVLIFVGKKIKVSNSTGFDITKDIISEYNSINIIESKNYFSVYNIKRKVIKLSNFCYYGKSISAIVLSLVEAGISFVDNNKNKYIDVFRKIFNNIKLLYIFPIFAIIINYVTYTVGDVKVSMGFMIIFAFISYIAVDIKSEVCEWIKDKIISVKDISEYNALKIVKMLEIFLWIDRFIFFGELIIIIRFVAILLEFI